MILCQQCWYALGEPDSRVAGHGWVWCDSCGMTGTNSDGNCYGNCAASTRHDNGHTVFDNEHPFYAKHRRLGPPLPCGCLNSTPPCALPHAVWITNTKEGRYE